MCNVNGLRRTTCFNTRFLVVAVVAVAVADVVACLRFFHGFKVKPCQ